MIKLKSPFILTCIIFIIGACGTTSEILKPEAGDATGLYKDSFGVQAYSFRNYFPKDMIGTLDKIQEMGITKIEGDGGRIPPEEFRKLCAARGISVPSTGASFHELEKDPMTIVDKAKKLGANFVMCAWVPHEGVFSKTDADKAIRVFNDAGKILSDNKITLAYHAHGYEFQPHGSGTLLDYMITETNPRWISTGYTLVEETQ